MTLLSTHNLSVSLGARNILDNVSLSISAKEIVSLIGPNGSGKTTLIRAVLGSVQYSSGSVHKSSGLRLGYVPQKLHIDHTLPLTVERFLCLPTRVSLSRVRDALFEAGTTDLTKRQMSELSGGQFQRVLLARALLNDPELLILDEPTQGLDQPGAAAFYRQIEGVRNQLNCGVLLVSHELHVVMAASDRVVCLNGHICCQGSPYHVASTPEYLALFGPLTGGGMALYRHDHDHSHDHTHSHEAVG
jgi:zinc transport system ATP-binding protein